jgi:hypothetical protein
MANQDLNPSNGTQGSSYLYDFGTSPNTRVAVSQKVRLQTPSYGGANLSQIGVVSSFNPSQSRTIDTVRGIGFGDTIAELVPGVTDAETGSFERALLYMSNLWQATGYAGGVDGPVRSLRQHRWPFDIEQQLVFSTLVDADMLGVENANSGSANTLHNTGTFTGGINKSTYPDATVDGGNNFAPGSTGHSALITMYEACWFNSWGATFSQDSGMIMESGDVTISDTHDYSSVYGEFLATGNDPTIGQLGSIRYNL